MNQSKRIKMILSSGNFITCEHCKGSYMPFKPEYEYDYCPLCKAKFIDDIPEETSTVITQEEINAIVGSLK